MFERFTDQSRRAVIFAQEEAARLDHDHVGTEHMLAGLVRETPPDDRRAPRPRVPENVVPPS
jgi:Clp amino terminal domain, pathogenicity island component